MERNLPIGNCQLPIEGSWNIIESSGGYRFWPDKVKGEGFFISCVKKLDGDDDTREIRVRKKLEPLSKKEKEVVKEWVKETDHEFVKVQSTVFAVPGDLLNEVNILSNTLHVIYSGTLIGELVRDKLIPGHALAMSVLVSDEVERVEVDHNHAINYLKKKELREINTGKGWKLITYRNYPLGWINALPNRINNYYPKELRILKDI